MKVELDYNKLKNLIQQMVDWGGDESGFNHLANYILQEIYNQYPELKELASKSKF
jgi:hypothetical protein